MAGYFVQGNDAGRTADGTSDGAFLEKKLGRKTSKVRMTFVRRRDSFEPKEGITICAVGYIMLYRCPVSGIGPDLCLFKGVGRAAALPRRLRELYDPYRHSSMSWADWTQAGISFVAVPLEMLVLFNTETNCFVQLCSL